MRQFVLLLLVTMVVTTVNSLTVMHKKLSAQVHQVTILEENGSSLFAVTDDGVFVIEPFDTTFATEVLKAIRNVTNKKITHVFASHNHWDHASGTKVLQDEGAKFIVHEYANEWIKVAQGKDQQLPDQTWTGNSTEYSFGNITLELHYFGKSHGLGMTVFLIKDDINICYAADLGTKNMLFFRAMPDYDVAGTIVTLKKITELEFDTLVYAHQTDTDKQTKQVALDTYQYMFDLRAEVKRMLDVGVNILNISSTIKLEKYENWAFYKEWLPLNADRIMMDNILGPWNVHVPVPTKDCPSHASIHPISMSLLFILLGVVVSSLL